MAVSDPAKFPNVEAYFRSRTPFRAQVTSDINDRVKILKIESVPEGIGRTGYRAFKAYIYIEPQLVASESKR